MEPQIVLLPQENIDRLATAIGKQVAVEILNSIDRLLLQDPTSPCVEIMLYLVGIAREEKARNEKRRRHEAAEARVFDNQRRIPEPLPLHIRYEAFRKLGRTLICPGCNMPLPLPELSETDDYSNIPITCSCVAGKMIYNFSDNTLRKSK